MNINWGKRGRDGSPEQHGWRFCSRALTKRAGVSLRYINQGSCESEQGIDWHLNMSLVRWGKGLLSIFGFQNSERKLRDQKRLRKDAKKWFKGLSRCFAVRNLNSSICFVYCKGGGEATCLQAGCTSAEGECSVERAW